jgi:hypothetical protein
MLTFRLPLSRAAGIVTVVAFDRPQNLQRAQRRAGVTVALQTIDSAHRRERWLCGFAAAQGTNRVVHQFAGGHEGFHLHLARYDV